MRLQAAIALLIYGHCLVHGYANLVLLDVTCSLLPLAVSLGLQVWRYQASTTINRIVHIPFVCSFATLEPKDKDNSGPALHPTIAAFCTGIGRLVGLVVCIVWYEYAKSQVPVEELHSTINFQNWVRTAPWPWICACGALTTNVVNMAPAFGLAGHRLFAVATKTLTLLDEHVCAVLMCLALFVATANVFVFIALLYRIVLIAMGLWMYHKYPAEYSKINTEKQTHFLQFQNEYPQYRYYDQYSMSMYLFSLFAAVYMLGHVPFSVTGTIHQLVTEAAGW
ncbi:hypothetical protein OAM67_00140 [bacterium]|nr:hypothetical protein [bacterium]